LSAPTPEQFRTEATRLGFLIIGAGSTLSFADRRDTRTALGAERDRRGRIDYAATLAKLRAARALAEAARIRAEDVAALRRRILDRLAPSAFVPPRATLTGDTALRQLAEDMRQASQREGGVTRDDLELLGWTSAQLDATAAAARRLAQSLAELTA
jgi:hypothetical protein